MHDSQVVLRDGGTVSIRAASPGEASGLFQFFRGLSAESREARFFGSVSEAALRREVAAAILDGARALQAEKPLLTVFRRRVAAVALLRCIEGSPVNGRGAARQERNPEAESSRPIPLARQAPHAPKPGAGEELCQGAP